MRDNKENINDLPLVSIVFVTYNRAHTLVATYETLLAQVDYPRECLELIVSDDASDPFHREIIDQLDFDVRSYAKVNQGLGANSNRGIRAAKGKYVLFMQDDWITVGHGSFLREMVTVLENNPRLGIIMLRDARPERHAHLAEPFGYGVGLFEQEPSMELGYRRYSDNPHLKRRDFHDKAGWYREGVPMTVMENEMTSLVNNQNIFQCGILKKAIIFVHIGRAYSFNPTYRFNTLKVIARKIPFVKPIYKKIRSAVQK